MKQCDCHERIGVEINSMKSFEELQNFFDEQVEQGIFSEKRVRELQFMWKGFFEKTNCYADKWYKCNVCGTLWEFKYPDFPANGYVKKFPDGKYTGKEVVKDEYQLVSEKPKLLDAVNQLAGEKKVIGGLAISVVESNKMPEILRDSC